MSSLARHDQSSCQVQKYLVLLLLSALFAALTGIGAREYLQDEASPGTLPAAVGRMIALYALVLMLLQPALALRIRFLDRIFGLDQLLKAHRFAGMAALTLAFLHPLLIYFEATRRAGPMNTGLWPEALGGICLAGLWLLVVSSCWRKFVVMKYEQWLKLHRYTAPIVLLGLVHMFVLAPDMRQGWLALFWSVMLILWAGLLVVHKLVLPSQRAAIESFVVVSASAAAEKIWRIDLKPVDDQVPFGFIPGQFAFLSFNNAEPGQEEHPFTIASAPVQSAGLQFLIKEDGDWTAKLNMVRAGDMVRVSGPFGVFSPWRHDVNRLILIAGGIGITPMLSILRQLREEKSALAVKLIWTFQSSSGAPCLEEIEGMRQAVPAFEFVKIATREPSADKSVSARLDQPTLAKLLPEYQSGTLLLVCGPTRMMHDIRKGLSGLGYPHSAILSEEFSF